MDVVIRIVHISDTHSLLFPDIALDLPAGDMLIHSGDFCHRGSEEEFVIFNRFLESVKHIFPVRIVVFGKNDMMRSHDFERLTSLLTGATHVLCDAMVELFGIKFYGMPWKNPTDSDGLQVNCTSIPDDIDILISHVPPRGLHDLISKGRHVGSIELIKEMVKRINPQVHLFGHIHEAYGATVLPYWKYALSLPAPVPDYIECTKWLRKGSSGEYFEQGCNVLAINSCLCEAASTRLFNAPHVIEIKKCASSSEGLQVRLVNVT